MDPERNRNLLFHISKTLPQSYPTNKAAQLKTELLLLRMNYKLFFELKISIMVIKNTCRDFIYAGYKPLKAQLLVWKCVFCTDKLGHSMKIWWEAICMLLLLAEPQLTEWERKAKIEQYAGAQWGWRAAAPIHSAPYWEFSLFAVTCAEIVRNYREAPLAVNVSVCHR